MNVKPDLIGKSLKNQIKIFDPASKEPNGKYKLEYSTGMEINLTSTQKAKVSLWDIIYY